MRILVQIPASLRQFSSGERQIHVDCEDPSTVGAALRQLHATAPGVVERALDEQGQVREHVNIFVDGESIRAGRKLGLETRVQAGTEVWILPAVSGGA